MRIPCDNKHLTVHQVLLEPFFTNINDDDNDDDNDETYDDKPYNIFFKLDNVK
ncbi:hypothetical protein F030043B2_35460 [Bacteroides fragilis]